MREHSPTPRRLAGLRRRMERLYPLRDLNLPLPGTPTHYTITLPANPNDPLDQFAAATTGRDTAALRALVGGAPGNESPAAQAREAVASGARMPYWSLLWASGQALAAALLANPAVLRGRGVLELGCGLGVTATAALACGPRRLWAADCFAEALLFCRYNTLRNTGHLPQPLLVDWRTPAGRAACVALAPLDLVLAADVLYEQEDLDLLLTLIPLLLSPTGTFWLAEPGRRVSRAFVEAARARGWRDDELAYEQPWPPDGDTVRVAVHRFTLPAALTSIAP